MTGFIAFVAVIMITILAIANIVMCFPYAVGEDTTVNADVMTLNYFKADNQRM